MDWIDVAMEGAACPPSPILREIEKSYITKISRLESETLKGRLPFLQEEYEIKVSKKCMLIPCWKGEITISKIIGDTTYRMLYPIVFDAEISGVFNFEEGKFKGFTITPAWGFHLIFQSVLESPPILCLGEMDNPKSVSGVAELRDWGAKIAELMKNVNLSSLGSIRLPAWNPYLTIENTKSRDHNVTKLLQEKLIEPLI